MDWLSSLLAEVKVRTGDFVLICSNQNTPSRFWLFPLVPTMSISPSASRSFAMNLSNMPRFRREISWRVHKFWGPLFSNHPSRPKGSWTLTFFSEIRDPLL